MSAVGLTKAMRRALESPAKVSTAMLEKAFAAGFLIRYLDAFLTVGPPVLTPRGHAALAAPRMTQAQLALLEIIEKDGELYSTHVNQFRACCEKGWVDEAGEKLTPSGLKALNDVRAATGSELYKDNMP